MFGFLTGLAALAVGAPLATPAFDRVFTIVLENRNYDNAMKQSYFQSLASRGRLMTNYHGVTHPSQPNYIAMISGSTKGVSGDGDVSITDRKTIVDLLDAAGKSWTTYQQAYPGGCYTGSTGTYYRKHNPFISFPSISGNPARCANIVNADRLAADVAAGQVASFVYYTPDIKNDGHDTDINYSAQWMQPFLDPLLSNPLFANTLFVVTFDESETFLGIFDNTQNKIATILLGPGIAAGSTDSTHYDHYSYLATVEKVFGLPSLGQSDASATAFF
ncbi:hypothetical protein HDV03_001475 [Kappamyces sp. JEL0829]|nr:hypothetical protein HDV03_001475 [Kappamyces sp. JEL0829]